MMGLHHREPGVVGAVVDSPDSFVAEIIGDGIHVHPAAARMLHRLKGSVGIALVSDAVEFLGKPDGVYRYRKRKVTIADGRVSLDDGTLCGSARPLNRSVMFLQQVCGLSLVDIAYITSTNPARLLGLAQKGSIALGQDADLVAMDRMGSIRLTLVGGVKVYLNL